jgi:uracil-DNA glycosylase
MPIIVPPSGPANARIMVVGEAPGADEEARGVPFVGVSGMELDRMLHEAGIMRSECFVTNVARERPLGNDIAQFIAKTKKEGSGPGFTTLRDKQVKKPIVDGFQALLKEVNLVQPNIIIALGNTPMWALTGRWGVMKHRGSMLYASPPFPKVKVIPTLHPAYILRDWGGRVLAVHDLKRAARYRNGEDYPIPSWSFTIRPDLETVIRRLQVLITQVGTEETWIDFDLETKSGHIDCAGISWSRTEALCIPFMSATNKEGYWTLEEEAHIVWYLYKLLTHKNCLVRGQNLLYDCQYTYRHWHFIPNVKQDTMISQHVMFAGLKKSLDFQASMYCDWYVQWKPDKAAWAEGK